MEKKEIVVEKSNEDTVVKYKSWKDVPKHLISKNKLKEKIGY